LYRSVKLAALLFELLDNLVKFHGGMLALVQFNSRLHPAITGTLSLKLKSNVREGAS